MISKEQREYLLKNLSKSPEGVALKEYVEETIERMIDISTITSYEELIGKQVAIKVLKETLRFLELLKEEKQTKNSNQYI